MTARFAQTYCSQCGAELGPGDAGVANCYEHEALSEADRQLAAQFAGDAADLVLDQGYIGGLPG